uniref:Uncharacterized protein n=1 Tax=Romanomermis culicivorax TaxID=13658 RepID=A0A915IGE4_ROMCU
HDCTAPAFVQGFWATKVNKIKDFIEQKCVRNMTDAAQTAIETCVQKQMSDSTFKIADIMKDCKFDNGLCILDLTCEESIIILLIQSPSKANHNEHDTELMIVRIKKDGNYRPNLVHWFCI